MRDIFPARLMTPSRTYERARVLIEDDRTRVYVVEDKAVKLVHDVRGAVTASGAARVSVDVEGETWFVKYDGGGCSCKRKGPLREASVDELRAMTLESV